MNILELDLLTPGSVWNNKKNGKTSRVICLTNSALPEKLQASNPQQVVYLDEEGAFFSQSVETFIDKRSFYNVDPTLESAVTGLATFFHDTPSDEEVDGMLNGSDAGNDDGLLVVGDDSADSNSTLLDDLAADAESYAGASLITYIPDAENLKTAIDAAVLADATLAYDQTPLIADDQVMHTLIIANDQTFTKHDLARCFSQHTLTDDSSLFEFQLAGEQQVSWDTFAGVYPILFNGMSAFKVVLISGAAFLGEDEGDELIADGSSEDEQPVEADSTVVISTEPATTVVTLATLADPVNGDPAVAALYTANALAVS